MREALCQDRHDKDGNLPVTALRLLSLWSGVLGTTRLRPCWCPCLLVAVLHGAQACHSTPLRSPCVGHTKRWLSVLSKVTKWGTEQLLGRPDR
jgi:hypothetical protein